MACSGGLVLSRWGSLCGCVMHHQPSAGKPAPGFANKRHPFGAIMVPLVSEEGRLIINAVAPFRRKGGISGERIKAQDQGLPKALTVLSLSDPLYSMEGVKQVYAKVEVGTKVMIK